MASEPRRERSGIESGATSVRRGASSEYAEGEWNVGECGSGIVRDVRPLWEGEVGRSIGDDLPLDGEGDTPRDEGGER